MPKSIQRLYGNKLRTRICGICIVENKILMVNHSGLHSTNFWSPPGGGLEIFETSHNALKREFMEETKLQIAVKEMLFVTEFIAQPLHAIELFFEVEHLGGDLGIGKDPEMEGKKQIIKEVRFLSWKEIQDLPPNQVHGIFQYLPDPSKILDLRGYIKL